MRVSNVRLQCIRSLPPIGVSRRLTLIGEGFMDTCDWMDVDWCEQCERVVPEGTEHDYTAHRSSKEQAEELAVWKRSFKEQQ